MDDMDYNNQYSIKKLPNELLLHIFRELSALQFVVSLPIVCEHWLNVIASDTYTLQRIGIHHMNKYNKVDFFYLKPKRENYLSHCLPEYRGSSRRGTTLSYCNAFFLCTQFSQIFRHIKTLVISNSLSTYRIEGFTQVNNVTTLEFFKVEFHTNEPYILGELSSVYPCVENVLYVYCYFKDSFDKKFLHTGFKNLKRFRLDHHSITHLYLLDLLNDHDSIEEIEFNDFTQLNDLWIDILTNHLTVGGRKIKSLHMSSSYFTDKCVKKFLMSNFFLDKSLVNISKYRNSKHEKKFSITLV